jgi:polyribonucleotide nucleotidyltransferase
MTERVEVEIGNRTLSITTGHVARQANGAVWVQYGDTVVQVAIVAAKDPETTKDFFPLQVDYREKAYAAGKIPGGFFKREGRPSEKEILSARMIDRPLRPLFPEGFRNETQVYVVVLSSDQENDADVLGIIGASAAMAISDIPYEFTLAGVRVGRIGGQFVVNPTIAQLEESDLNLILAGTDTDVVMVEGGCNEISENDLLAALEFGMGQIKTITTMIDQLKERVGKPKFAFQSQMVDETLVKAATDLAYDKIRQANTTTEKQERQVELDRVANETIETLSEQFPEMENEFRMVLHDIEREDMRRRVLEEKVRADGRGYADIRPLSSEVHVLPRTHGSAIFTRGQTQALAVVTLGTKMDEQRIDDLMGDSTKTYMLHYNFPAYSVGEIRRITGPGRREIGHGALAERALQPIIPNETIFPYTLRVVSDILESNGSSSMATVCGGTLAMMDAGVPIKAPVAGVAMGLIKEGEKYAILSDILGVEDHLGDMDFKVTGTREGITAFQMDIKIRGLTMDLMHQALQQAKVARCHILDSMEATIAKPRAELSPYAPRIISLQIKVDKIGDVIGPGGKNIRAIVEKTGAKIDIEDDGTVIIASVDQAAGEMARDIIIEMTEEPEIGKEYDGRVRRITNFGAFLEIIPGTDGLLHISEIDYARTERVEDFCQVGDVIRVKVVEIDPEGKIRLSRKALLPKPEGYTERPPRADGPRHDGPRRDGPRRDSRHSGNSRGDDRSSGGDHRRHSTPR